jgi:hypothetical protein
MVFRYRLFLIPVLGIKKSILPLGLGIKMPLLRINKNIMSFSLWNNFLGNKTVSDFIPQFNVTEAFKDIRGLNYKGLVKQSVLNNGSYLKGVNTLKSMKDLKFYEELFQDRKSGNISNYSKTIKDFPTSTCLKTL